MQPEFRCNKVVTLEVIYPGTQLKFWYFVLLGFYSLALNLSIMSHLSDSQRLKVCCTLVVTLEVTYLSTQLRFWAFCTLEVYSLVLILSIMSYQDGPLSNSQRLGVC